MTAWVDGQIVGDAAVPRRRGVAPFETMGAVGGELPLWDLHVDRLAETAARLGLAFAGAPLAPLAPASPAASPVAPNAPVAAPAPPAAGQDALRAAASTWRAAAGALLRANGHTEDVLRLALVPGATRVHAVMVTRARSPVRIVKLLPTVVPRPADAPPGDVKAEPRGFYDAVRQQAQDGQADDGLVIASDGAVLEAALGNVWLRLDGVWVTPPLDGRVLPGIARALLLAGAHAAGVRVVERACDLADLHRADALAHSNAVHGVRPACLVGRDAAVAIVDSELGAAWRSATVR